MSGFDQASASLAARSARRCAKQEVKGQLTERAESYASDARKFRDAGKLGQPIVSAEHDARWATSYQVIADELRKVAAGL